MGCGQKGPLVLPTGEAAVGRATLPETLLPTRQPGTTPSAPAAKPTPQPVLR
ncbi:lipoprotein [Ramlibacter aurantiacus]|uniref:lipoprotein n=1 Tax=Ramlibacter aurantiacus TaxID=2801330 RepID=UPI001F37ABDB